MNNFRTILDDLEVKEMHLHGRRYTWTSGTANPTMTKIDHVFMIREWELMHPNCHLQALGTAISNHCPMVLNCDPFHRRYKRFRFEAWWLQQPDFGDIVQQSWSQPVQSQNKARILHIKLARLAKRLKHWNKRRMEDLKKESMEAHRNLLQLEQTQDTRPLSADETQQRITAKAKILGLVSVRRTQLRQRSWLTWIKAGDANIKLFHLRANGRHRKNFIPALTHRGRTYMAQDDNARVLKDHYQTHLGHPPPRTCTLKWDELSVRRVELSALDDDLTEEEIKAAVMQTPLEKAPGPNGFIGAFYRCCWDIIAALQELFALCGGCWNLLNSANITLIQKKGETQTIVDYRPISVMHSIQLMGTILAHQLAPCLDRIISKSQSAFIRVRSIHDNFQYVQGAVKHFHRSKTPMLFIKLDNAKAFDSVHWEYLLELLEQVGFGRRWRDILALLWSTTSSRILLNGKAGSPIKHG
jgi:hypothetical protein